MAGPGFVNFRLDDGWLHDLVPAVIAAGEGFGRSRIGAGTRVMVEFVSANPTGPVHAGHARGATYGDSLARLLEWTGHDVEREFYLNDRGVQMQVFAASLAARKAGEEPPEDGYRGEYITEWAAEMPDGADPLGWGEERAIADQQAHAGADGSPVRHLVLRASDGRSRRDRGDAGRPARARRRLRRRRRGVAALHRFR